MPAAKSSVKDKYANMLEQTLTMSATDTLTFVELDLGLNLFQKVALLINRIEYEVPLSAIQSLAQNTDSWTVGLSSDNTIAGLDFSTRALIDMTEIMVQASGTPAAANMYQFPLVRDYADLPGGGLLIAPRPLYLGLETTGFAAASAVTMRMYFTILQLKPDEYFELLESRRYFG